MECKFSEFQFAHLITREIEDKIIFSNLGLGMPRIPNQVEEANGGYDVSFHDPIVSVYLQYKLSEKLTQRPAKEWDEFGKKEYFRIKIYPDNLSKQHNTLVELAGKSRKNQVFYCAPAFTEMSEMQDYYDKREVANHSAFIRCYGLTKISGDDQHNICFTIDPKKTIMHSEPIEAKMDVGWESVIDISYDRQYDNIREFMNEISEQNNIQLGRNEVSDDLLNISEFFASKGMHMMLLKAK